MKQKTDETHEAWDENIWMEKVWQKHLEVNPRAATIRQQLIARGEEIHNDHIAFRTFDHPNVALSLVAESLASMGFKACQTYRFPEKKLKAQHFEHSDSEAPKIFVSELQTSELSQEAQGIISRLLKSSTINMALNPDLWHRGCLWAPISIREYQCLQQENEVAAWLSTMGFRANHFTIAIHKLKTFRGIEDLNSFIKAQGYPLNEQGGEIKGGVQAGLEQSSTLASRMNLTFNDGNLECPTCYDEFALRHPMASGELFSGFLESSADKIFESTHRS